MANNQNYLVVVSIMDFPISIVAVPPNRTKGLHGYSIDATLNAMGFQDDNEYIELYPGNFMSNSDIMVRVFKNRDSVKKADPWRCFLPTYICTHNEFYNKGVFRRLNKVIEFIMKYDDKNSFAVLPTVEELRLVPGLKSVAKSKLWFCKDSIMSKER